MCKNSSQMQVKMQVKVPIYILLSLITIFSTTVGAIGMDASYKRLLQPENANEISQAPHPTPSSP